jgi:hypothetical protein
MDHFYAFLTFAVILVLEQLAANTWLAAYYRFGLPVMVARKRLASGVIAPGRQEAERQEAETFSPGDLARALTNLFQARPDHPSIRFKALANRQKKQVEIAFHESFFEPRAGFRYLPVTHSLARLRLGQGEVTVTGYVDWYVLFVLVYLVLNTIQDRSFIFVAIVVLVIFGISYIFQKAVNSLVAERINTILAQSLSPESPADSAPS